MFGYISEMDDCIGDVIGALKASKKWDNTLVIFSSDNGAPNAKNVRNRNFPLRGFKTQIFEGGVKVPAIVSGGVVPERARGSESMKLYHVTDWLPTILNVAQQSTAGASTDGDGHNIFPSIVDDQVQSPRKELVYNLNPLCEAGQAGAPKAGIRMDINGTAWKLLSYCYTVKGIASENSTGPRSPPHGFFFLLEGKWLGLNRTLQSLQRPGRAA